jgi:ribonuclease HI
MYRIYIDGASRGNPGPAAAGFVVLNNRGDEIHRFGKPLGYSTNNRAEYEALTEALQYLLDLPVRVPKGRSRSVQVPVIYSDSELLVRQMNGLYRVRDPNLKALNEKARSLLESLGDIRIVHIPRSQNRAADALVNSVLDGFGNSK